MTFVVSRIVNGRFVEFWWWKIILGTPPDQDLLLAILVDCLLFVESLQSTVMAFVQAPRVNDRQVHEVYNCRLRQG